MFHALLLALGVVGAASSALALRWLSKARRMPAFRDGKFPTEMAGAYRKACGALLVATNCLISLAVLAVRPAVEVAITSGANLIIIALLTAAAYFCGMSFLDFPCRKNPSFGWSVYLLGVLVTASLNVVIVNLR